MNVFYLKKIEDELVVKNRSDKQMHYLKKYIGTYRVKADYDLNTNDFPRLIDGILDPTFDDLYIDCKNNIKIRHGVGNVLSCYIPSKGKGINILRQIYQDNISNNLPKEKDSYCEKLCEELVNKNILVSAEILDGEAYFEFKADMIDYIAKLVGAKTSGASISPFSSKNLPKEPYKIPEKDLKLYKEAIKGFPVKTVVINGKERTMVDGLLINRLTSGFDEVIIKSKPKKFDINKDRKTKCLKGKEYVHSLGESIWKEYCEFLKDNGTKAIDTEKK